MIRVALPAGDVEVSEAVDAAAEPWAVLALAHGAGAGMAHPFLTGFAAELAANGVTTLRFTFPYLEAGRRMPGPAAHAVSTWRAVAARAVELSGGLPWFAAGKSYGGRMASMAAAEGVIDPAGLVYAGYPLHPPGKPEKPRIAHLPGISAPQLFLAGTADPFLQPLEQFTDAVAGCMDATVSWTEGGGHSFEVKGDRRPPAAVGAGIAASAVPWLRRTAQRPAA
ncbi:alpha/beta family hydrolase [Microbacterium sp. 179-B 1A2 NHS]|uniref:alpha/beta hydrolase family protein n=1 Tax=Microbacterium sp. 179-B 1A2 NHS TaxID=3142383 RepID=UPI0039A0702B